MQVSGVPVVFLDDGQRFWLRAHILCVCMRDRETAENRTAIALEIPPSDCCLCWHHPATVRAFYLANLLEQIIKTAKYNKVNAVYWRI